MPLKFQNGLTIVGLLEAGAYVRAITESELGRIEQQDPINIDKIDVPPNFQIRVTNGQLERPIVTAVPKIDV